MKLKVLGMYGGQLPGKRLTSFLLEEEILIDAGGLVDSLGIEDQTRIEYVVISHTHLDHIRDIPFLADNIVGRKDQPVEIVATEEVIEGLKAHFLNNDIWPDFTVIPSREAPVLKWSPKKEEEPFEINGFTFEFVRTNHPVPTFGMFIQDGKGNTLLYTADTGPTERIWEKAKQYGKKLKAIIVEVSFPNRLRELSLLSGHLSPEMVPEELRKAGRLDVPVYLFHFKPVFELELLEEVSQIRDYPLSPLSQGEEIEI